MESLTKNKQTAENILQMVQKAFRMDFTSDKVTVKELTEGFFNVAYEVTLPDQTVILKIAPPTDAKVMTYEKNMMKAEVEALRLVKEKTEVPVPEIIYYDDSHTLCNADYIFMEKIEGDNFFTLKSQGLIPYETQNEIFRQVGLYNYEMNQIHGTAFGYMGIPESQGSSWKEVFLAMIEEVLGDGERIGIDLGTSYDEVRELIQKACISLEEVTEPCFVHWDLWDGNIFVKDGRITGIIDFERALWAEPLMEFYFRGHTSIKEFYEGYGANLREHAPIRAFLYDMYLFLIMVIETKYRMYPDDWQYGFSTKQLAKAMTELKKLV
jgi:aminoglycoside phosphotransferase (APT) family kinase protein